MNISARMLQDNAVQEVQENFFLQYCLCNGNLASKNLQDTCKIMQETCKKGDISLACCKIHARKCARFFKSCKVFMCKICASFLHILQDGSTWVGL